MYLCEQVLPFFLTVIVLSGVLGVNISSCVNDCKKKPVEYQVFCNTTCFQKCLGSEVEKAITDFESARALPKPAAPSLVEPGWTKIRVRFNTTELDDKSDLEYILEVKPLWGPQAKGHLFVVYPYTKKYFLYQTNHTTYTVEDLEPNTGYRFRVIALKRNRASTFSDWSSVMNTTEFCETESPCGVTNIRLELTTEIPYQKEVTLTSLFRWKRSTSFRDINQTRRHGIRLNFSVVSECVIKVDKYSKISVRNKVLVGMDTFSSDEPLYYNCWYKLEIQTINISAPEAKPSAAKRNWIFHVPNCIQISDIKTCGCSYIYGDDKPVNEAVNATFERDTSNTIATGKFTWSDEIWRNGSILTYFLFELHKWQDLDKPIYEKYYNVSSIVSQHNATIHNLTIGQIYVIYISGYTHHHCKFRNRHSFTFIASFPCENYTCPKANSICHPVGSLGEKECKCMDGFLETKNECIQVLNKNDETEATSNTGVVVAAVLTPLAVILIAVCLIVCLRRRHRRQMNFMENEFKYAMDVLVSNWTNDVRSIDLDMLGTEEDGRGTHLIYVSPSNVFEIPEYISEPISRYELPPDSVTLRKMIGKGAFGRVYAGEAHGVNGNPELTAVAIKTLKESAEGEELCDFLREIDLMKDLGTHENVISMLGCCTKSRPICLVLEYAPGGNLLHHLRALKKKCKDIVAARTDKLTNSNKENIQKVTEPDEMPEDSKCRSEENSAKQDGGSNAEISNRIKEEIRAALDSKELESFSHQIASGMRHISDHGIVHRDLAARNILIGKDKILKISDFGLSREGEYVQKPGGKVPFRWLAIEAIQERSYSTASDVWAFGVVLWEICTLGDMPYSTVSNHDLKDFLLSGERLEKVENCTDAIYDIMSKCWSHLPKDRPTFEELSNKLWELRNEGSIYMNVDSLVKQSTVCEVMTGHRNSEEMEKDSDGCDGDESGDDVELPTNETPLITG